MNFSISILSRTEEPAKVGTCARDRRVLQQLALNVHVKHSYSYSTVTVFLNLLLRHVNNS